MKMATVRPRSTPADLHLENAQLAERLAQCQVMLCSRIDDIMKYLDVVNVSDLEVEIKK